MVRKNVFYWFIVNMHFNTFCVLCLVKTNEQETENKNLTKKLACFYNLLAPLIMM